ncbi:MAG: Kdo hydroxylase family protein [Legionellales bacterium]
MTSPVVPQIIDDINPEECTHALESGHVLFFPEYYYSSVDPALMTEAILDGAHKNISYDLKKNKLGGFKKEALHLESKLRPLMRGFAEFAYNLVQEALPSYVPHLQWGRTSFRPAQICGRASSKRKDDTRLHVDSFPASPVNGLRILRVFCNVNPLDEPRVWNIGEPFTDVLNRFAPQIPPYSKFKAQVLKLVKATKTLRSPYDHYMLHLHDTMKLDDAYQDQVPKIRCDFPPQSTWIVFTDQVSHAALSGQYLLEHTFYLPVDNMAQPELSPLNQFRKIKSDIAQVRETVA